MLERVQLVNSHQDKGNDPKEMDWSLTFVAGAFYNTPSCLQGEDWASILALSAKLHLSRRFIAISVKQVKPERKVDGCKMKAEQYVHRLRQPDWL